MEYSGILEITLDIVQTESGLRFEFVTAVSIITTEQSVLQMFKCLSPVARAPPVAPAVTKVKWGVAEDQRLLDAVAAYGSDCWARVATLVPGRSSKQCRERWLGQLSPGVQKAMWTAEEDAALFHGHAIYGNRWTIIAHLLPGRAAICVKNRWNWLMRRGVSAVGQVWLMPRRADTLTPKIKAKPPKTTLTFDPLEDGEDLFGSTFREFQATMLGRSTSVHQ
jgi:hypothetical protein